jgi:hypothetical protein
LCVGEGQMLGSERPENAFFGRKLWSVLIEKVSLDGVESFLCFYHRQSRTRLGRFSPQNSAHSMLGNENPFASLEVYAQH